MQTSRSFAKPALGLGTVQFGLPYGVSNTTGQTPPEEVARILNAAWSSGVRILDTARAYGESEAILGEHIDASTPFGVVTKLPPLPQDLVETSQIQEWVSAHVTESARRLRVSSLHGVLIHNPLDALGPTAGAIFEGLERSKSSGQIRKYGVSIYDESQIERIRAQYRVDLLQVPINVFDQRLLRSSILWDLRAAGIELHARSIFLQGLILMEPQSVPQFFEPVRALLESFDAYCKARAVSKLHAALSFIQKLPIDVALVGVNTVTQLSEIVAHYTQAYSDTLTLSEFARFKVEDERFVNPSQWR